MSDEGLELQALQHGSLSLLRGVDGILRCTQCKQPIDEGSVDAIFGHECDVT